MKIKELIGESSVKNVHFCYEIQYQHQCVTLELDDKLLSFFIPHWKFNLDMEVTPAYYHPRTGKVLSLLAGVFTLPIVYIED
jgi:hypothetical protein